MEAIQLVEPLPDFFFGKLLIAVAGNIHLNTGFGRRYAGDRNTAAGRFGFHVLMASALRERLDKVLSQL
jgi:hypothetical protein